MTETELLVHIVEAARSAGGTVAWHGSGDDALAELALPIDELGRERPMWISTHAIQHELGPSSSLLASFVVDLPYSPEPDRLDEVYRATAIINSHRPVGHFEVKPDGALSFRYALVVGIEQLPDAQVLLDLIALLTQQQFTFGDYLEGVCEGEVSVYILDEVLGSEP
jgi:hypothetical protein